MHGPRSRSTRRLPPFDWGRFLGPGGANLRGMRVLVLGLGVHGGAAGAVRFLVRRGAEVTVTDLKGPEALAPTLEALAGLPIRYVLGEHREEDVRAADLVLRNPAVPRTSPFLALARRLGIPVAMDSTLLMALYPGPVLGVTGTKGKTSTVHLLHAMLREAFPDARRAGTRGASLLEAIEGAEATTPLAVELSSWRLEGLEEGPASPTVAVLTNLDQDHLNTYPSMEAYARAKGWIFAWQDPGDTAVLPAEAPWGPFFAGLTPARTVRIGPGGEGRVQEGRLVLTWEGERLELAAVEELPLRAPHHLRNALAAAAAALAAGVPLEGIRRALRAFRGVPHRQEWVAEVEGVRFINDTTATAPLAAAVALETFADRPPLVWITGGADKGLRFEELAAVAARRAQGILLLPGSASEKLRRALEAAGAPTPIPCRDLEEAVVRGLELARPRGTVLLAPGCASFGLFRHEFERGEAFRAAVRKLQALGKEVER